MLKDIFTFLLSSEVILDPYLAEMLLHKSEGDRGTLAWDEVFTRYRFTVKGPPKDKIANSADSDQIAHLGTV